MPEIFARTLYVDWSDLDTQAHMGDTAYLDKAVDVRWSCVMRLSISWTAPA